MSYTKTKKWYANLSRTRTAQQLLDACKISEKAFVSRNEDEMMQAQCSCTAAIAEAEKGE